MEPSTYGLSIDKCLHWNCLKLTNNFGMSSPLLCFYPRWWTRYSPQIGSVRPQSPQVLLQPAMIGIITELLMVLLLPLSFLASAALRELWPKRLWQSNLARDSPDLKVSLRAICARCYSNTMGKPSKESKVVWNFPSPCLIARGYLWESSFFPSAYTTSGNHQHKLDIPWSLPDDAKWMIGWFVSQNRSRWQVDFSRVLSISVLMSSPCSKLLNRFSFPIHLNIFPLISVVFGAGPLHLQKQPHYRDPAAFSLVWARSLWAASNLRVSSWSFSVHSSVRGSTANQQPFRRLSPVPSGNLT